MPLILDGVQGMAHLTRHTAEPHANVLAELQFLLLTQTILYLQINKNIFQHHISTDIKSSKILKNRHAHFNN